MGSLDDTLRLEATETSPITGETPFASAIRPTASGLQWLAVPAGKAGWAFRIAGGTTLERLAVGDDNVSISATASIHAPATHVCASVDGRLVAVICIAGSMECFDATASGLQSRWIVHNCHSHITNDLSVPPSADRSNGASASGPVRSFAFCPFTYDLLLVDALKGSLAIYNASNSEPTNELTQNAPSNILSAAWSSAPSDLPVLALGTEDGSIQICRYQQNSLELLNKLECPNEEGGFCCTHLDWSNEYLLVGLCKVEAGDEEPDEDDEDDTAEHEAAMYMTCMDMESFSPGEWYELGDVVPFFSVPKAGRHAFYTSFVHSTKHRMCVVAVNVGTDVAVLAEEDGSWKVVEFEEGNAPTTPTDDEDEFTYPIGVGVVPLPSGLFQLLLPTTDGSLSTFTFQKSDDSEAVKVATLLSTDLDDAAVEMIESSSSPPDLTEEPPAPEPEQAEPEQEAAVVEAAPAPAPAFSFGSSGSSAFSFGGNNNATESKPVFGSGSSGPSFGAGYSSGFSWAPAKIPSSSIPSDDKPAFGAEPSKPSIFGSGFGQPSSLGGAGFGQPSTLGGGSKTGGSVFGQTSTPGVFGAPQTPQTFAAPAAPIFGAASTPSSGPVFGSGTTTTSGGFAALSATPSSTGFGATFSAASVKKPSYSEPSVFESMQKKTEPSAPKAETPSTPAATTAASDAPAFGSGSKAPTFSFGTSSASPFTFSAATPNAAADSPFNAFGSSKPSPTQGGFAAKPLFSTPKKEAEEEIAERQESPDEYYLSDEGKIAARVFDSFDEERTGSLPIETFEDLADQLGEGFHGDEYDNQVAIIDPTESGYITRDAFIDWYSDLVEGDDSDYNPSMDSEERAEREEERQKALAAFQNLSGGNDTIPESDFPKLIESLNTVYCEEEHSKTLKVIARAGEIHLLDFLSWYVGWLFGGDASSDEEEEDDDKGSSTGAKGKSSGESLGALFAVDSNSWKCEVCSVRNKSDDKKCAACETVRPGFEDEVAKEAKKAAVSSGSAIGSGGFSFGGSSSSGGIGSGGFTFGAPSSGATGSTSANSGGGFTFGAAAPATGDSKTTTGFTFGAPAPAASTGFTFGTPKADASKPVTSAKSSSALDPKDVKAPNPFAGISLVPSKPLEGSAKKTTVSDGKESASSVAFPPMSTKAPTPFSATTASTSTTSTKAPTSAGSAAFPPMSTKAPTPFSATSTSISGGSKSSAAFPPMSMKAPTPFSATSTSTSGGSKSSAAFPPMSTKAPTPFSATTTSSSTTSTKATTSASSAAFPPMSTKAPTPFSATSTSTSGASKSSAAFPPMSTKAPTPFSATTTSSSTTSTKATTSASSAAFPPMSTKAPTPFSATSTSTSGASKSSAAFPPMSTKAPTPFSATTTSSSATSTKATTSASSAAFPPMSTKAPTPFSAKTASSSAASTAKATTPGSSAAFPPMSSAAPTPFGANTTTGTSPSPFSVAPTTAPSIFGSSSTTSAALESTVAFPPMSSKAPTPFGSGQPASKAQSATESTFALAALKQSSELVSQASSSRPKDRLGISSVRAKIHGKIPEPGAMFLDLAEKMERNLDRVGEFQVDTKTDRDFEPKIQSVVDRVQNHRASLIAIGTSVARQRQTNAYLLSRQVDTERQITEAKRLVDSESGEKLKLAETLPLDYESEVNLRRFAASSRGISETLKLADKRLEMLETATSSRRDCSILLGRNILDQAARTDAFEQVIDRINKKLDKASDCLPLQEKQQMEKSRKSTSTYGLTPRKQRSRPQPLAGALTPLSNLATSRDQNASSARKWGNVTSSLQSVGNEYSRTVRVGGTSRLKNLRRIEDEKPTFKSPSVARSLLLSPSHENPALQQSSSASSSASITIFSPRTKTKARDGWDTVSTLDQMKVRQLSFSVPGELKEATLTDASRSKLERLGTTPEKVQKSIDIKNSHFSVSSPTLPQEQVQRAKPKPPSAKKEVSSAAFPPMSSKAPTNPFSNTAQKSTDSKPPIPTKPKQESSYPPISAVASKPFSSNQTDSISTTAAKKDASLMPSKTADDTTKKSDPFSIASMGSSLFSADGSGSGGAPSPFGGQSSMESSSKSSGSPDYNAILVAFYQKHNPAKIAEVGKTLEKYKGREVEMFQKLAQKYRVKSPLEESQSATSAPSGFGHATASQSGFGNSTAPQSGFGNSTASQTGFGNTAASQTGFGNASASQSPFSLGGASTGNGAPSPFQSSGQSNTLGSASPFSSGGAMNTGSAFGKPPASPFGPAPGPTTMGSSSPFGNPAPSSTPFGSGGLSSASPFGAAPSPSPFGVAATPAPASNSLQGKDPRQMLMQFYQQHNPTKLGEVDKVLVKYRGNEEQLFRNLAKKYNLDPSAFGLPPAPAAGGFGSSAPTGFGQASALGSAPAFGGPSGFGQPSQMGFGSTNTAGSGMTFGSGMSSAQGTSSFGSLAQAPSPSPFGSSSMGGGFGSPAPTFGAPSMGFGGSTPFGAPRR